MFMGFKHQPTLAFGREDLRPGLLRASGERIGVGGSECGWGVGVEARWALLIGS